MATAASIAYRPYLVSEVRVTRLVLEVPTAKGTHKGVIESLLRDGWSIKRATHPVQSKTTSVMAYDVGKITIVAERPWVSRALYKKRENRDGA